MLHSVKSFTPEYVLTEFYDPNSGIKATSKKVSVPEGEFDCYINSQRYVLFARDGLTCSVCGRKATVCKLELPTPKATQDRAHFNFYCEEGDKLILLTKDHKIAKANGGKNIMDNYIPMCQECNTKKGAKGKPEDITKAIADGLADPLPTSFSVTIPKTIKDKPEYINIILDTIKLVNGCVLFSDKAGIRKLTVTLPTPSGLDRFRDNITKLIGILADAYHHTTIARTVV